MTLDRPSKPPIGRWISVLIVIRLAGLLARRSPRRIRRTLELLRRGTRPATYEEALQARENVVASSARCAGRYCLDRSLAIVLLLRSQGRSVTWCAGVRTSPFAAHAWVESDGRMIGEPAEESDYVPMIRVQASA